MSISRFLILIAALSLASPSRAAGPSSQELLQAASSAEAQGYRNLAIHYYTHALKANPGSMDIQRTLARALQKNGNRGLAELHWRKVLEEKPGDGEATQALQVILAAAQSGQSTAEDTAAAGLPMLAKSEMPWTKGHGAWVYGDARSYLRQINEYNHSTPRTQKVKYFFPASGTLVFNAGQASLKMDLERALIVADNVAGESLVFPMIEGVSSGSGSIMQREWDRVGKEIADKINAEDRVAGVLLSIEPNDSKLNALYAYVKKYTTKPVGAAIGIWETNTFKFLDFAVLTAFDHSLRPPDYSASVRDQIRAFLRDARAAKVVSLIGVPAIATHHEYEGSASSPGASPTPSGYKMLEYVDAARRAISQALVDDDPSYQGNCIWALHPEGGLHKPADQLWYYPTTVSPAIWEQFKLPLTAEIP